MWPGFTRGLFPLFGLIEAFAWAVRWDRKGLYRSRWGNYDLVPGDGIFTFSEGLVVLTYSPAGCKDRTWNEAGFMTWCGIASAGRN